MLTFGVSRAFIGVFCITLALMMSTRICTAVALHAAKRTCRELLEMQSEAAGKTWQQHFNAGEGSWINSSSVSSTHTAGHHSQVLSYSRAHHGLFNSDVYCENSLARSMRHMVWIPKRFSNSSLFEPVSTLPPGLRILALSNSYMGQLFSSIIVRAVLRGEALLVETVQPSAEDILAEMEKKKVIDWETLPHYQSWRAGDAMSFSHLSPKDSMIRLTLENDAVFVYSANHPSQAFDEDLMLSVMLAVAGWDAQKDVDVVVATQGNKVDWAYRYFKCHQTDHSKRVCDARQKKEDNQRKLLIDLDGISDALRKRGFFDKDEKRKQGGLFLTAPEEYVFDSKTFNASSYAFSFNFNKVFTSQKQLCRTDRWTKQAQRCSRMGGHQCMPGIPDVLGGVLTNVFWEHYCGSV
eukprot:m.331099 g.331099  ORF g.331099 m.331099 type:complete len:408 (+) comp20471_c0_seq1:299-1522(+)